MKLIQSFMWITGPSPRQTCHHKSRNREDECVVEREEKRDFVTHRLSHSPQHRSPSPPGPIPHSSSSSSSTAPLTFILWRSLGQISRRHPFGLWQLSSCTVHQPPIHATPYT
ncbi:hypothetical protein M413DRAFT_285246 [Hebeloma cylindrosporum]|uniref:Uncharacterized protein n=1 Tax=Hebeloma cylindrosporum TaxID=76867 RepID=A0A0C3BXP1_HEBCY|nr:hypothetical protein M413DRAFT_285246 [Hebeloma cylindrosporum h7]